MFLVMCAILFTGEEGGGGYPTPLPAVPKLGKGTEGPLEGSVSPI